MPWKAVLLYSVLLAAGVGVLQWIEYQHLAFASPGRLGIALLAALFLGLGIWVGAQLFRTPPAPLPDGNPKAQAVLGISAREKEVLELLAAGQSNKEIARTLGVSPNTVKTHVGKLLDKLEARRRTEAVSRARDLGIVS